MDIELSSVASLRFDDGAPLRAASAVAGFGGGWLIAQDDATHGGWLRDQTLTAVRLLPSVEGRDVFDEASGTKHLKPDLEAACEVTVSGAEAVLLLGSGSSPARMRACVATLDGTVPRAVAADLSAVYARVARALGVEPEDVNMEGACVVGELLRWFQRGLPAAGLPTASVDLDLGELLAAAQGHGDPSIVEVRGPREYDLGDVDGVGLAVTDAVALGGGLLLVSSAAEDTPNPRDDGPVVGSALALLDRGEVVDLAELPTIDGQVAKVEGLSVLGRDGSVAHILATVDADDPEAPSVAAELRVRW